MRQALSHQQLVDMNAQVLTRPVPTDQEQAYIHHQQLLGDDRRDR